MTTESERTMINPDGAAYAIDHIDTGHISLRVYDVLGDDTLVVFEPAQLAAFRDALTDALTAWQPELVLPGPLSSVMVEIVERTRRLLHDIDEHKKREAGAVADLLAAIASHLKSSAPMSFRSVDLNQKIAIDDIKETESER